MKKLVMGCAVAGLIALSPKSEAKLTGPATLALLPVTRPHTLSERGVASWYGCECQGNLTADGELYDMKGLTAAHRNLPFGTTIQVTNLSNNRSVVLRINDRGPIPKGRLIDVSEAAAKRLGFLRAGLVPVEVRVLQSPKGCLGIRPHIHNSFN